MPRGSHNVGVVIAAGGSGTRYGGSIPKQFLSLKGRTVLQRTLEVFESISSVRQIVVVSSARHLKRVKRIVTDAGFRKVSAIVPGGKKRQDSVLNGLLAFRERPEVVLVHDAVRPLVTKPLILAVIREAARHGAALTAVPVTDTIKTEGPKGFTSSTLDRSKLWAAQTPQGFRYEVLIRAHHRAMKQGIVATDDASLVERLGIPVRLVTGSNTNIKLTTRVDWRLAEMWLK